jgi:dolichyl-phosphate beta-glucosyltransferase
MPMRVTAVENPKGPEPENTGSRPSLSLVIPAYNDSDVIESTLVEVLRFLADRQVEAEVIVVDDGSTDGTPGMVERIFEETPQKLDLRLLRLGRNQGKGAAVRAGMLAAQGEVLLFTDSDLSTPIEELDRVQKKLDEGYDVVIGSRALPDSRVEVHQNLLRERAGKTFNLFVQLLVLRGFRDTQCGFKCFRREAARTIFERQRCRGFEFDVELLCLAREQRYRIAELPVVWRNNPRSHVRFLRDSTKMFFGLLEIRRRFSKKEIR